MITGITVCLSPKALEKNGRLRDDPGVVLPGQLF